MTELSCLCQIQRSLRESLTHSRHLKTTFRSVYMNDVLPQVLRQVTGMHMQRQLAPGPAACSGALQTRNSCFCSCEANRNESSQYGMFSSSCTSMFLSDFVYLPSQSPGLQPKRTNKSCYRPGRVRSGHAL